MLVNGTDYPGGRRGRQVVAALAACYMSGENNGKPVSIDSGLQEVAGRRFPWAWAGL